MNAAELPDDTVVYAVGFGETTAGALRSPIVALDEAEDATVRMWVWICAYSPDAQPWRTGRFVWGGKEYPVSEFSRDRFLPLSTSSGTYRDVDVSDPCACQAAVEKSLSDVLP